MVSPFYPLAGLATVSAVAAVIWWTVCPHADILPILTKQGGTWYTKEEVAGFDVISPGPLGLSLLV